MNDEYACASDHPSQDLSDLALAVRDDSFTPAPRVILRTYSSSEESFEVEEREFLDTVDEELLVLDEIKSNFNGVYEPAMCEVYALSCEPDEDMEYNGYASIENNTETSDDIDTVRTFAVTDQVPASHAQLMFVMAWNGESSSCGEDIGDIETIPSEEEVDDMENGMENEAGQEDCKSIHTMESSAEAEAEAFATTLDSQTQEPRATPAVIPTESGTQTTEPQVVASAHVAADTTIKSDGTPPKVILDTQSSADHSQTTRAEIGILVMRKTDRSESCGTEESGATDSECGTPFQRKSDTKASLPNKQKAFKRFTKLFARCFGRQ